MGSDKIGPVRYSGDDLQRASPEVRRQVEIEVRELCSAASSNAALLLKGREKELHRLAKALLEYETLNGKEVKDVLAGKGISRDRAKVKINKDGTRPKEDKGAVSGILGGLIPSGPREAAEA